jgi:hypothetical protein
MRKQFIFALLFFCLLEGCSHYHSLDIVKKERLVSELVSSEPKCSVYKNKLKSPSIKDDDVDTIFHEALKAQCIYKDV